MINDFTTCSEKKIVYCDILDAPCIKDTEMHDMEDAIMPKCPSCWIYKSRIESTLFLTSFNVGELVETTPEFKEASGLHITGKVEECNVEYIAIKTHTGACFYIYPEWIRGVSQ